MKEPKKEKDSIEKIGDLIEELGLNIDDFEETEEVPLYTPETLDEFIEKQNKILEKNRILEQNGIDQP